MKPPPKNAPEATIVSTGCRARGAGRQRRADAKWAAVRQSVDSAQRYGHEAPDTWPADVPEQAFLQELAHQRVIALCVDRRFGR
jgi:hypothetical protein